MLLFILQFITLHLLPSYAKYKKEWLFTSLTTEQSMKLCNMQVCISIVCYGAVIATAVQLCCQCFDPVELVSSVNLQSECPHDSWGHSACKFKVQQSLKISPGHIWSTWAKLCENKNTGITLIFRSTPKSRPNNMGQMSVRPSVHKKFFRFWWNLVCR